MHHIHDEDDIIGIIIIESVNQWTGCPVLN
jgi:hypothetical protein